MRTVCFLPCFATHCEIHSTALYFFLQVRKNFASFLPDIVTRAASSAQSSCDVRGGLLTRLGGSWLIVFAQLPFLLKTQYTLNKRAWSSTLFS